MNRFANWMVRPPAFVRALFPFALWRAHISDKRVFLTFDDGPVPGVTPWVIEQLKEYDATATFFCVGDNIQKYPGVFDRLLKEGYETGSHTFSHVPAYRHGRKGFFADLDRDIIFYRNVKWFRPPHGIFWPWWHSSLKKRGVKIAMWDVLSRDYDRSLSTRQVTDNVLRNIRPGSVVVFHDSLKAWPNLKEVLPVVLNWLKVNGYKTDILSSMNQKQ